jgi:Sec-independent protein translocase protein TatA
MRGLYESTKSVVVLIARELKNVARSSGGLTRWFKENWVDVKTGKPCGRSKGEKRGYPACRPKKRVSSKTPKTVGEMTASEKTRFKREKTSSKKITYQHRRKKTTKRKKK